jgi:catechol 2,3-dioxygenase-like lactoylglutathione lyase family enzyme
MRSLNLLVLRCRDVEASRTFYETFGLRFTKHAHGTGPEHYAHEDDRGVLELYPATSPASGDLTGLGFAVGSLEETARLLTTALHAPGPIRDNPWGRSFVVRDPDGRRVEVTQGTP